MTVNDVAWCAGLLEEAERARVPVDPLTKDYPELGVDDAYRIQLANIHRRLQGGATVVGHKVGLSSAAMQRMMGVDEPDYGHLLDDMQIVAGSSVLASHYLQPRVEVEVAVVLDRPLAGPDCTLEQVIDAVAYVSPAIELIDSRIADWEITIADTIADNASSAGFILGPTKVRLDDIPDIRLIGALLWRNEELVETGAAGAVLGHPLAAVAWLANRIHEFGVTLERGHVILPGSCTRAVEVRPGDRVHAEFDRLGDVRVDFL